MSGNGLQRGLRGFQQSLEIHGQHAIALRTRLQGLAARMLGQLHHGALLRQCQAVELQRRILPDTLAHPRQPCGRGGERVAHGVADTAAPLVPVDRSGLLPLSSAQ